MLIFSVVFLYSMISPTLIKSILMGAMSTTSPGFITGTMLPLGTKAGLIGKTPVVNQTIPTHTTAVMIQPVGIAVFLILFLDLTLEASDE